MKKNPQLRIFILLALISLIMYALADGIRYGSVLGIILAAISMMALVFSFLLTVKLKKIKEEEEGKADA